MKTFKINKNLNINNLHDKLFKKALIGGINYKKFSFIKENEQVFNMIKDWWNPNGNMKMLHIFNDLRLNYIDSILKKYKISLENKNCLDIGCGGGLLTESLRRKKANVLGIDPNKNSYEIAKNHLESYKGDEYEFMK